MCQEFQEELEFAPARHGPPLFITSTQTVGIASRHVDVSLWYEVSALNTRIAACDDAFVNIAWLN